MRPVDGRVKDFPGHIPSDRWEITPERQGLKVAPTKPEGGPLRGSPYRRVFAATMERATQQCNALDQSDAERFK